jgi:anti-sigma regulatory factor (Ser/Thr protein kinase)
LSQIRLEIESDLSSVCLMAMAVNKICSFYGMNELDAYKVELSVTEAATNAIVHAYGGSPGHPVSLLVSVGDSALLLDCMDRGKPMTAEQANRVSASSPMTEQEGESLREGGRGLQIIRGVMDKVSYMTDEGLNCLSMVKLLKGQTLVESGSQ